MSARRIGELLSAAAVASALVAGRAATLPAGDPLLARGTNLASTASAEEARRIRALEGAPTSGAAAVTVDYPLAGSVFR